MARAKPYRWEALSRYNSECSRGVVHTAEVDAAMAVEQVAFDETQRAERLAKGWYEYEDGVWAAWNTRCRWWQWRKRRIQRAWGIPS
jgi:hypothetical protein